MLLSPRILKRIEDQGFGYISHWDLHNKKIRNAISDANKLSVKYDENVLQSTLRKYTDYDTMTIEAEKFFSKFSPIDKIKELIQKFSLQSDQTVHTPSRYPSSADVLNWVEFKQKHNLKDIFGSLNQVSYYDLDKNILKIHFYSDNKYEFENFYELIFNEKCSDIKEAKIGEWHDLGKISIRRFKNNSGVRTINKW